MRGGTFAERVALGAVRADDGSGCLLWVGTVLMPDGYARFTWKGRKELVHRIAWEEANGRPVPDGLQVDHVKEWGCRHRNCIEPSHLEAVTPGINTARASTLGVRCRNDRHDLVNPEDWLVEGRSGRTCKQCSRDSAARHRAKRKREKEDVRSPAR